MGRDTAQEPYQVPGSYVFENTYVLVACSASYHNARRKRDETLKTENYYSFSSFAFAVSLAENKQERARITPHSLSLQENTTPSIYTDCGLIVFSKHQKQS